jgi:hypothetical protein
LVGRYFRPLEGLFSAAIVRYRPVQIGTFSPVVLQEIMAKVAQRKIGNDKVSAIGLGAMGMSAFYSDKEMGNDDNGLKVLTEAADSGVTFWDTR